MRSSVVRSVILAATVFFLAVGCAPASDPGAASAEAAVARKPSASAHRLETFTSNSSGFDTHSYWLDTGHEVVVFDAQFTPELARQLLAAIRAKTASPVRFVVVTHPNPDKFNGASVFQAEGAKLVASRATAASMPGVHSYKKHFFTEVAHMFTEATYPALPTVDITFEGSLALPLEGEAAVRLVELRHAGVSSTQTVAVLPHVGAGALVVGDLVHEGVHAWLEGGIVSGAARPDLASWRAALLELRQWPAFTVYGGRGGTSDVERAIRDQTRYLDLAEQITTRYVQAHPSQLAALKTGGATEDQKAISAELQAAFPAYGLSYLVDYGVYGLIAATAAASASGAAHGGR